MTERKEVGKKFGTFFVVNFTTTLIEFVVYSIVARILGNDFLWLATIIGGAIGAIISFILNKRITWKKANVKRAGTWLFFLWNGAKVVIIKPALTFLFATFGPLYEAVFSISGALNLPFDMDFIESTGVFCLVVLTTMVLSYLVYDRLVFCEKENRGE